jgi:starch synthase (maltosyl-transferring)
MERGVLVHATDGRVRVVIEGVRPQVDCGEFAIKRIAGDTVTIEADIFADGHDELEARLLYRRDVDADWREAMMKPLGNDRWAGEFTVDAIGGWRYTVEAWVSRFRTWRGDLAKRIEAGQDVAVDLLIGADLLEAAAARAGRDGGLLRKAVDALRADSPAAERGAIALEPRLAELAARHPDRSFAARYGQELRIVVDRERARYSTWYELFPRSCSTVSGQHGSFRDCEARLDYVKAMGFDVLYLPPIHPIGRAFRKGRNNAPTASAGDVGSPWAIGGPEGGHTAIHPDLGTLEDFQRLRTAAAARGIEIALDIAYQCTPDHPWVSEHPEWFRRRPDGTIQYAENPPKKYQDIYPLDFETPAWRELWEALRGVMLYWIEQGVRIFRVDNPHTKAFGFWEWAITSIRAEHPDVIFLSEAFTRPKVMYRLAKLGFTQSYTYFTWRNTKAELTDYFRELTATSVREFFRPNLWPNTPDILPEVLQTGGRPAFALRLLLAATLGASYGIYGPAYELGDHEPREPGSEEYLNSEKYEIKQRDLDAPHSLRPLITAVNQIRRENPALQRDWGLRFHETDHPALLVYSKATPDRSNVVLVLVNLDPRHPHEGCVTLDLAGLGLDPERTFEVEDLLEAERELWSGASQVIRLDPAHGPGRILRLHSRLRTERDFDYFA